MGAGVKWDTNKPRLTLIDPDFQDSMATVLGFGEDRYGRGNWKNGISYSRIIDAIRRHTAAIERGEDIDPDTGEPHAAHAACGLMFFDYYRRHSMGEWDDRNYKQEERIGFDPVPGVWDRKGTGPVLTEQTDAQRFPVQDVLEQPAKPPTSVEEAGGSGTGEAPTGASDGLTQLQKRIKDWADTQFPLRTAENALRKLIMEEIPELLNGGLDDPMEYADVLILILDVASLKGIDPVKAAWEKMAINEKRSWSVDPLTGLLKHNPEPEDEE